MKVSQLLSRESVLIHADVPDASNALGILVELQEAGGVITREPVSVPLQTAKRPAAPPPSARASPCPTPATPAWPRRGWRPSACVKGWIGARRTESRWT